MTENKPIMISGVDVSGCDFLAKEDDYCSYSGEYRAHKRECGCSDGEMCKDYPNCFYKKALKQLACKTQECEILQQSENEAKEIIAELKVENEKLKEKWSIGFNQYCDKDNLLSRAERKLEQLTIGLKEIFRCLIKANRNGAISDTIWITDAMTLWDYIVNLLELQGDQNEIEKQIIDEVE